jgi:hypothetical protein
MKRIGETTQKIPAFIAAIQQVIDAQNAHNEEIKQPVIEHPEQGQFIVAAPTSGSKPEPIATRVGFCVQIRRNNKNPGSIEVFLRNPDGFITIYDENTISYGINPEQEQFVRDICAILPEKEDYASGYYCSKGIHKVGYLIDME